MSTQTTQDLAARFRTAYDNFGKGDLDAIRADFTPDVVWHSGGNNILSGDYKGIDDVFALFGRLFQETGGTFKNEVHDVMATETHGVALVRATGERNGKKLDANVVHVVHYDPEGLVKESWIIPVDAKAADEFWS